MNLLHSKREVEAREPGRYCTGCAYDLRESTGRCPECGRAFDASCTASYLRSRGQFLRRRWGRRVALVVVVLVIPAMLVALGFEWLKRGWEAEQAQVRAMWSPAARRGPPSSIMLLGSPRGENRYGWVKGVLPAGYRNITDRVTEVKLHGLGIERVEAAHMERVGALSHLRSVQIVCATVTPGVLRPLARLDRLEVLMLSETAEPFDKPGPWTAEHLADLAALRRLRELHLTVHSVLDSGLSHVGKATTLEKLVLRRNGIRGDGLDHLAGLTRLKALDLSNTQVRGETLAHLVALSALQELDLSETPIGDNGVPHLLRLTSLKELRVRATRITDDGIRRLKEGLPAVRVTGPKEINASG